MLYRILLFSVKPQHESGIGIHISPPFWTSLPSPASSHPSRLIEPLFKFPEPYSKFLLGIYFTYSNASFHVTLSIHLTLSSALPMSVKSISLCLFLPCCPVNKFFSTRLIDFKESADKNIDTVIVTVFHMFKIIKRYSR